MGDFLKDGKLTMEQQITMSWGDSLRVGITIAAAIFVGVMAAAYFRKVF